MVSMNLPALIAANKQRWATAKFKPSMWTHSMSVATEHLCEARAKAIYKRLEAVTGVPWFIIALIHWREASGSWKANIANGQRWDHTTTIVPKGRGPFKDFTSAALDALEKCPPHASQWKDWSAGGGLTLLELYNGEGYELYHHIASPYLWSGTEHYIRGKYDGDGHWNGTMVDPQLGCAILLRAMMEVDKSILAPEQPEDAPEDGAPAEEAETDPTEYPEPVEHAELHPDTPDDADEPKSILKSKISNTQIVTGAGGAGLAVNEVGGSFSDVVGHVQDARSQLDGLGIDTFGIPGQVGRVVTHVAAHHPTFGDVVLHAMSRPTFWVGVAIVAAAALTIFWRWKDHGKGAPQ